MLQLVIPAYNEEVRLPSTLDALHAHLARRCTLPVPVEVIVVDNASTDQTARVARAADRPGLPVRVVGCARPGKGAAVRAGVAASDADTVGFMDADGATGLRALDDAWQLLQRGADVAIASRAVDGARTVVRHSTLRGHGASLYRQLAARVVPGVADTQCGFKLMHGALARSVFEQVGTAGFSFDVEVLARARAHGAVLAEFPAAWADVAGSKFSPLRHGARSFADLARISWQTRELRAPRRRAAWVHPLPAPVPDAQVVSA